MNSDSNPGSIPDPTVFRRWFEALKSRDPALYAQMRAHFEERVSKESVSPESPVARPVRDLVLETIVREGRPALLVKDNKITPVDPDGDPLPVMIRRLRDAAAVVEPLIPLVGRIDVSNHAGGLAYVGTGWLIDKNVIATNRHVAEVIARGDGGNYEFRAGRFGDALKVSVDYRRESGNSATASVPVQRVIWIESDTKKADFALLEVGGRSDGLSTVKIDIADTDAEPDTDVAVIGYPARAPSHIIPDQAWMDRIYGGTYDVKRVAPGLMGSPSRGWATHDCTTLGGNSGSVVVDMKTGRAVALHFAGLYLIENYCVPASTLREYLRNRPWHLSGRTRPSATEHSVAHPRRYRATAQTPDDDSMFDSAAGEVSVTIPLHIRVSLGRPDSVPPPQDAPRELRSQKRQSPHGEAVRVVEAARAFFRQIHGNGVLAVRHGYLLKGGGLSDLACLVVAAKPDRLAEVRARVPKSFDGFPVDVRQAPIGDQVVAPEVELSDEAPFSISYNDDDRTGPGFSFEWVEEPMDVRLHVGPERSWSELSDFLLSAKEELVSSIYEFHAAHIADALERELDEGTSLTLVMAAQSRDPQHGDTASGDFDRSIRFAKWEKKFDFERIFVPIGKSGLVARSYHIKVTVRDRDTFWLSSGNWKRSSQPKIATARLDDKSVAGKAGNREWHVVVTNETLALRFRNHILADFEQALALGGSQEAVEDQALVDVPLALLEGVHLEAAPGRVFSPKPISRKLRVKPLLTPDLEGEVYCLAVKKLIRSAKRQILFQNQYISVSDTSSGLFSDLVDALVEKSAELDDVRIILRSGGNEFWDAMAELKRRGMDVNHCVRRLANTHTKGIIVDGRRVLVGSHNWSSLGVTLNRDASLLFEDEEVARYFADVFEEDWNRSSEVAEPESVFAEEPRVADPSQPVPDGFVRMTLADYLEG